MDWAKTTARQDEKHLSFWIWCVADIRGLMVLKGNMDHPAIHYGWSVGWPKIFDFERYWRWHWWMKSFLMEDNDLFVDFVARSRYLRQGWVIASHSILWDAITHPCLRNPLLATKFSFILCCQFHIMLPFCLGLIVLTVYSLRLRQNGHHLAEDILKFILLNKIYTQFHFKGSNCHYSSIGWDNGLALNRRQDIF